jgi:hypothetical protein
MEGLVPLTDWEVTRRARHAFETYFLNQIYKLPCMLDLERLNVLPPEICSYIAKLAWPCSIHPDVVIRAEAPDLQNLITIHESINRELLLNTSLYIHRVIRAGVSYISSISYTDSPELVWENGPISEIMIISDGIGVFDISIKGYEPKTFQYNKRHGLWYKSISSLPDKSLDQVTIHFKV